MNSLDSIASPEKSLSDAQRSALLKLLADEDPAIYSAIRKKILSCGPDSLEWLRPGTSSNDPALRRRAQELVLLFDRQAADNAFLGFCLKSGEELDLEQGAWLLAQTRYPEINPLGYQALLDDYAGEMRFRLQGVSEPRDILTVINRYLFCDLNFAGDEARYYDPENNYLNRVMDRRLGNPINLSLLYILLARRLRLPVAGVGLPGHFICRFQSTSHETYIDAFGRGKFLSKADCIQYLSKGNYDLKDDYLAPVSSRRMLVRICSNLHHIYRQAEQAEESVRLQRYIVALTR